MLNRKRTHWEDANCELSQRQVELDLARRLAVQAVPPRARWTDLVGWLGLSAGVTMLVGAFALWAATQPQERPKLTAEQPTVLCPPSPVRGVEQSSVSSASLVSPAPLKPEPPSLSKRPPRNAHHVTSAQPPRPRPECDGRDPLCGLDLGTLDDVGKRRR